MRTAAFLALPTLLLSALLIHRTGDSAPMPERDRSPIDLALSADGRLAITANATSDTASLADVVTGKVLAEVEVGKRPFAVALTADSSRAVVTNWLSNTVTVLRVTPTMLHTAATISVGEEPRGVALASDGKRAFVALGGENCVAIVDLAQKRVAERIKVGAEPWHLALTADGKRLIVGNVRSQDVSIVDVAERKVTQTVKMRGRNLRHIALSPDGQWAYVPHISEQGRPTLQDNIDNGWVIGNRLGRVPLTKSGPREAMALDPRGRAVGDVDGVAIRPDGSLLAVTAAGTHELLLFREPLPFYAYGGPPDHIDPGLREDANRFRRIPLGGRPMGVRCAPNGKTVVVANYLNNSLQVVDVEANAILRTIALGGPKTPSLARQGEALFMDATRSFNQWYSCNTCHTEGHTNGGNFDTFNDGSYLTSKKTLSLRGVTETGPWTWHGWRKDLRELIRDSFTKSMQGEVPGDTDVEAMLAYFKTLDFRPLRRPADGMLWASVRRGEGLFQARDCQTCHAPPLYTREGVYQVGLETPQDAYPGFNPPSLRGVGTRAPYLHDGRTNSLEDVLKFHHRPSQLTGKPDFTPDELADVVAFLKTL